ncbi:MAG TPA: hypothetical protein PKE03_11520 [Bacteroidales bacterium]|nr:hypothetical protein [Bacteroidales bacterium]
METEFQQDFNSRARRPSLLTFLCILSFTGSGLSAISGFFVYLNHQLIQELVNDESLKDLGMQMALFSSIPRQFFLLTAMLNIVSFVGVRYMWMLRRAGFHLYAISQLLIIIVSSVYIYKPSGMFPGFDLMLTTLFILMYLRFREVMV